MAALTLFVFCRYVKGVSVLASNFWPFSLFSQTPLFHHVGFLLPLLSESNCS